MKILLFAAGNILLVSVALLLLFSPKIRDINHLRQHISRQESQYAARVAHDMVYEENLEALESLQAARRLLTYEAQPLALEAIHQAIANYSLTSRRFDTHKSAGFYGAFGPVEEMLIVTENDVTDPLGFLYALENTHANVLSANMFWEEGYARMHVNMSLLFARD